MLMNNDLFENMPTFVERELEAITELVRPKLKKILSI